MISLKETLGTYHAHTEFCDGKSTAEEMVLAAIEAGAPEIGLTPHSPILGEPWCMDGEELLAYKRTARELKEKYKGEIAVFMGIEEDFISGTDTSEFDFVIGSVHCIEVGEKKLWVDLSPFEVRENVNKYFHSDPYFYIKAYYENVGELYEKTKCDIIGHFDLVTKFLERDPLFSTDDQRYIECRNKALDKLIGTPALFEVNTGAISRGYRTVAYPEEGIRKIIADCGKPFVINSDSHSKETVLFGIEEERKSLEANGYKYIKTLSELLHYTRG